MAYTLQLGSSMSNTTDTPETAAARKLWSKLQRMVEAQRVIARRTDSALDNALLIALQGARIAAFESLQATY